MGCHLGFKRNYRSGSNRKHEIYKFTMAPELQTGAAAAAAAAAAASWPMSLGAFVNISNAGIFKHCSGGQGRRGASQVIVWKYGINRACIAPRHDSSFLIWLYMGSGILIQLFANKIARVMRYEYYSPSKNVHGTTIKSNAYRIHGLFGRMCLAMYAIGVQVVGSPTWATRTRASHPASLLASQLPVADWASQPARQPPGRVTGRIR